MTRATTARRSLLVLIAIIASLALTAPAGAAPPDMIRWSETYEFVVPAADNPCGVDLLVSGEVKGMDQFFYDKNGDLTKIAVHVNDKWTETGLPDGGTVNASASLTYIETNFQVNADGSFSFTSQWTGIPVKLQVPGLGVISVDAGNAAVSQEFASDGTFIGSTLLWEHGQHPFLSESPDFSEDWIPAYCGVITG
jgi:hypothetical protein